MSYRIMKTLILGTFVLFSRPLSAAEELPVYPCYQLTNAPVLDGSITKEDVWQNIPAVTGFFILGGGYAYKQTYFKAGWTKDALYLVLRAEEPLPEKMLAKGKDGDGLWDEDSIEMFFSPEKGKKFFQLIVNSIGSRWNALRPEGLPPQWKWQAKTHTGEDFWSAEIKIPFTVLERMPEKDEVWAVNISRNILTGPATERYTCWPPLQNSFSEISNFGSFVFKKEYLSARAVKDVEKQINAEAYLFLKKAINKSAGAYISSKDIIEEGMKNPKFREEATRLKKKGEFINILAQKEELKVEELSSASAKLADLEEGLEKLKGEILSEQLFE